MRAVIVHDKTGNIVGVAMVGPNVVGRIGLLAKDSPHKSSVVEIAELRGLSLNDPRCGEAQEDLVKNYRLDLKALTPTLVRREETARRVKSRQ